MSNPEYLPVTHAESLQNTISQTVKIGKQLMISELSKRHTELNEAYNIKNRAASEAGDLFHNTLNKDVKRQVHMEMANDSELTRFRNLYSRFSRFNGIYDVEEYPKFKSNVDMLQGYNLSDITLCLFKKEHLNPLKKDLEDFFNGIARVTVNLVMPDRKHRDDGVEYHDDTLGYEQTVRISQDIIDLYKNALRLNEEAKVINNEYNAVEIQLKNIDKVTEEMEAKLLVQELNKTEAGKAALEITASLVGNMLGTAPQLINKD